MAVVLSLIVLGSNDLNTRWLYFNVILIVDERRTVSDDIFIMFIKLHPFYLVFCFFLLLSTSLVY